MLNGSSHEKRCTYTAPIEVTKELNKTGTETEILHAGEDDVRGCMGCGACVKLGRYIHNNDEVNEAVRKLKGSDDLVMGSPVHYVSASGAITSFLDRFFYPSSAYAVHKPGAAVAFARRAGTMITPDQPNKYFMIPQTPVVSSQHWNMVYRSCPEDVKKGEEGMRITCILGRDMVWPLQSVEAGKKAEISCLQPEAEERRTNFVR